MRTQTHRVTKNAKKRFFLAAAGLLAMVLSTALPQGALAQVTTGDVVGTVSDSSGAHVPHAKVTVTNTGTQASRNVEASDSGEYTITLLPPGHYVVTIEMDGFKSFRVADVALIAGDRARVDGTLSIGAATETVEVTSTTPLLQADSSAVSSVVTENAVQDLPLNGRNYNNLVQVQAGVNTGPAAGIGSGTRPDDRRQSSTFSANGQSDLMNNQLIDGMDNNERVTGSLAVRPSVDAIAEVKVDTNNYSAEIGRSAGAVVNVITKSGTNQFHGSVYEFFRNDIFDARDFFAKVGSTAKPRYRENQFGGSIGGPIFRDKTFFFADFEGNRIVQGTTYTSTVPTQAQHDNPASLVPAGSTLDPVGLNFFKLFPAPNIPGATVNNFVYTPSRTYFANSGDARVDHHFNDKNTVYARFSINQLSAFTPGEGPNQTIAGISVSPGNAAQFAGPNQTSADGIQIDYTRIIRPDLVLDLKAGYVRVNIQSQPINKGTNAGQKFGLINSNLPNFANTDGLATVNVTGYASLGDATNLPIIDVNNSFQEQGSLSYSKGAHSIKIGGQLIRRQINRFVNVNGTGLISFNGSFTGNALSDLLTGKPLNVTRSNQLQGLGYRVWEGSGYIQDDWRINEKLTVNVGGRYDVYTPVTEEHNLFSNFDPTTLTLKVGGSGGIKTSHGTFAPRVGFAQSLGSETVIRGGFGISYYPIQVTSQMQNVNAPVFYTITNCKYPCNGLSWPNVPIPTPSSVTNLSGGLSYLPPNYNVAAINQANLNMERAFGATVFTLGYVGQFARHLSYKTNIDLPDPTGPYPTAAVPIPPKRLYATQLPNVTAVASVLAVGTTNYHSMQTSVARRFKGGLSFNGNYTWAHGLGDAFPLSFSSSLTGALPRDPKYDYGNTELDIRHRISVTANYEIPSGKNLKGFKGTLAKGWQLNSLVFWQSGTSFMVGDNKTNVNGVAQINLPNTTADRPNIVSGTSLYSPNHALTQFLNLAAFTPQPAGTPGNERRDPLYGPATRRADLSVFKTFQVTDKVKLQARAECFNISNTPNFANPNFSITGWARNGVALAAATPIQPGDTPTAAGGFGSISATNVGQNPRQFQFAAKILF